MLEPSLFQHPGIHVVLEVSVVERQANAVQLQAGEEGGVGLGEVILEPLVKEIVGLFFAQHFLH
jgi:hypothetical protein